MFFTFLAFADHIIFAVSRDFVFAEPAGKERRPGVYRVFIIDEGHHHVSGGTKNSERGWEFGANWLSHFYFPSVRSQFNRSRSNALHLNSQYTFHPVKATIRCNV